MFFRLLNSNPIEGIKHWSFFGGPFLFLLLPLYLYAAPHQGHTTQHSSHHGSEEADYCSSMQPGAVIFQKLPSRDFARGESLNLTPLTSTVYTDTDFVMTYVCGPAGLPVGGALKIQFPPEWGRPQFTDPSERNYIYLTTSRYDTLNLWQLSEATQDPLSGIANKRAYTLTIMMDTLGLLADDSLTVYIGNRFEGGEGFRVSRISGIRNFYVAIDTGGSGDFQLMSAFPFNHLNEPVLRLSVTATSNPLVGEEFPLTIVALDKHNNPVIDYSGTVVLTNKDGETDLPGPYTFQPDDSGRHTFMLTIGDSMVHRILVEDMAGMQTISNPILAVGEEDLKVFWGDLHTHSNFSGHGVGTPQELFHYGKYIANLDFLAYTEHSYIIDSLYRIGIAVGNSFNEPGEFITINGYEWTTTTYGHKCVYFKDDDPPEIIHGRHPDTLYKLVLSDSGLIHAAHPSSPQADLTTDWDFHHDGVQKNCEITGHSGKRYELPDTTTPPGTTVTEALNRGYKFGFVGASDNHHGRPGKHMYFWKEYGQPGDIGMTGVRLHALNREEIFDALDRRFNYATTGARILMDFSVDDMPMGTEYISNNPTSSFQARVYGSDSIIAVEIIKNGSPYMSFHPQQWETSFQVDLTDTAASNYYYLKVTQADGHVAWSSPVWKQYDADWVGYPKDPVERSNGLSVFPNPGNGLLYLKNSQEFPAGTRLRIINAMGQKIYERKLLHNAQQYEVDCTGFSPGIYILQLHTQTMSQHQKFLIQ